MLCGTVTTLPILDTKVIPFRDGSGGRKITLWIIRLSWAGTLARGEEGALSVRSGAWSWGERKGKEDRIAVLAL